MSRGRIALATIMMIVAALVLFLARDLSPERAADLVAEAGPMAWLVFVLAFAFIQPLGVSGHIFCLGAVVLWPPLTAFCVGLAGAVGAAVTSFFVARYLARDAVQAWLPERARRY
ncbi:MAG: putative membrane protein YdjX (TVP38/TMEM64 family), partial [Myxococcota bacterium]